MDTTALILFAEQLAGLLASTITSIRGVVSGASTQTVDEILADADTTYQTIITNAKGGN